MQDTLTGNRKDEQKIKKLAEEAGEYGKLWSKGVKYDENVLPTIDEMMNGLFEWYYN